MGTGNKGQRHSIKVNECEERVGSLSYGSVMSPLRPHLSPKERVYSNKSQCTYRLGGRKSALLCKHANSKAGMC